MPVRGRAKGTLFPEAEMAAATVHSEDRPHVQQRHMRKVPRPKKGTPSVFSVGRRSYVQGEVGKAWPDAPHFISFNQEIKLLSSFKLSIHGRSPLIQLRFQDLWSLLLLPFLLHNWWGDSRESRVRGPGICGDPGDLS